MSQSRSPRLVAAALAFTGVTTGCVHRQSLTPDITSIAPADAPPWISEDCTKRGNSYVFVGYGEGANPSTAIRNAMVASRQSALVCLFGGKITATVNIRETNQTAEFDAQTQVHLDYSHVNWSGYEIVPGRVFHPGKDRTKAYAQYRWNTLLIDKERSRLEDMSKAVEETNALKQEVALKGSMIEEQKRQIGELKRQEQELAALSNEADRAVARLEQIRKAREQKAKDITKVIGSLYCGLTVGQFIDLFRSPDREEVTTSSEYRYVSSVRFYWDQFVISVPYDYIRSQLGNWPKAGERDDEVIRIARTYVFREIAVDYGQTGKGYRVCQG